MILNYYYYYKQLNHINFGTHIKKPDSMQHVKLIEFHKVKTFQK
jgi:hypothetical protein